MTVQNSTFHDCYNNAAENGTGIWPGTYNIVTTYRNNYFYNCPTALNILGDSLSPSAWVTNITGNTFQYIGEGPYYRTSNYLSGVVFSTQFTTGIQGDSGFNLDGNVFIDVADALSFASDGTPYGLFAITVTNNKVIENTAVNPHPGFILFSGSPLGDITVDGNKAYRTSYAVSQGLKLGEMFTFSAPGFSNLVIKNNVFDCDALELSSELVPASWSTFTNQAPLWQGNVWAGGLTNCPTLLPDSSGLGLAQTVTSGAPTILPALDNVLLTATGGTVAATIQASTIPDADEFTVTVVSGTVTFTTDSNQFIKDGGGTITLSANGEAKFHYVLAGGKWVEDSYVP
jgi:hypothetical protein